jgi:acetylornithine/succinyldiaminopimelate/putrescine aminotransferase
LKVGEHGTTFGGGPLACRVALETLDVIEDEALVARSAEVGTYLMQALQDLQLQYPVIREVRGMGLMVGVEIGSIAPEVVQRLLRRGVISNAAHGQVLRLVPPLIVTRDHVDEYRFALAEVLKEIG